MTIKAGTVTLSIAPSVSINKSQTARKKTSRLIVAVNFKEELTFIPDVKNDTHYHELFATKRRAQTV